MHIAAANPLAISSDQIPSDVVERERAVFRELVKNEGKPEAIWDKIVDGKIKKFYQDNALLDQQFGEGP